jgi:thiosulfate/3-mercaptopyruvate sulfurtransferase
MTERSELLVTVDQLREHLHEADWCIVDVRHDLMDTGWGRRAYAEGHIPGAVFAHIDDDLSGAKNGRNGRHPLPDRAELLRRFRQWGINDDSQIVAYDANGGQFAARLWWLARWLGHDAVALLDGGWPAWLRASAPTTSEVRARPPGRISERPSGVSLVTSTDVLRSLEQRDRLVLDARTPERYRGEQEPIDPVAGHIPGARNRPWMTNLTADQTFKPPSALRREFVDALGDVTPPHVVHQCGSGITACQSAFAMELAGLPGSALYAGSWSEWIADPARPVATGDESPTR